MIIPSSKYPGQIDVSDLTNYPQGKARNRSASGATDGTPAEKAWVNDWFGFQQAAVLAAGITPSGNPDTALASDVLAALRVLIQQRTIAVYEINEATVRSSGATFPLTLVNQFGGFSLASDAITVPAAGKYRVTWGGLTISSDATNPTLHAVNLYKGGASEHMTAWTWRYSTGTTQDVNVRGEGVCDVTTPGSQAFSLVSGTTGLQFQSGQHAFIVVDRIA